MLVKFKQLVCKHNYKPWANIYGDIINNFNGDRTILLCPKCCKRKYIKEFIEAPLNANNLFNYLALEKQKDPFSDSYLDSIIKNKDQYQDLFENSHLYS